MEKIYTYIQRDVYIYTYKFKFMSSKFYNNDLNVNNEVENLKLYIQINFMFLLSQIIQVSLNGHEV